MNNEPMTAPVSHRYFTPGTWVLLALALVGACFAIARFAFGLGAVTNLTSRYPWGIWIGVDVASGVALAAGGFTTAALAFVFHRRLFQSVMRPALLTAWLGYVFVVVGLLVDLGRYFNVWHPMIYWQGNSVLFEVGICVMFYLTVLSIEFAEVVVDWLLQRGAGATAAGPQRGPLPGLRRLLHKVMPAFIIAGVVLSCLHQSSLGALMLVAPYKLSPLWYTPILPLLFLLSAIAVGLPMVIFESILAAKAFKREVEDDVVGGLARFVPWTLGIYAIVKVGDFVARGAFAHLADAPNQSAWFVVEVVLGVLVPLALFAIPKTRASRSAVFVASCLVIFGVLLNRINVFMVGFQPPYATVSYFPAIGEIAITIGLMSTLILIYRLCVIHLPIMSMTPGSAPAKAGGAAVALLVVIGLVGGLAPRAQADDKDAPLTFDIRQAPDMFELDHPSLNAREDAYGPVRFMHRAHANTIGDCTACHHRVPQGPDDRVGVLITSQDLATAAPTACEKCHHEPLEADSPLRPGLKGAFHQRCIGCHEQERRGPVGCRDCHDSRVPSHADLVELPDQPTPQQVTAECIRCHSFESREVMTSVHWLWHGASPDTIGEEHAVKYGKDRIINNFCIDLISNWPHCTSCHVGYGWKDAGFDFDAPENVDCLVCHDTTGTYKKYPAGAGNPVLPQDYPNGRAWPPKSGKMVPPVDLVKVAGAVGVPSRKNCGACHFYGGGGDNVKHGDLSSALADPPDDLDVHMGRYNMVCQDCHATSGHKIAGGCLAVPAREGRVSCTQCHADKPHVQNKWLDSHLNDHTDAIACQTCHIPAFARSKPTNLIWDWSQAGQDKPMTKDEYGKPTFHKKKGALKWGKNVRPSYAWYDGMNRRYQLGDKIDPSKRNWLNEPIGRLDDPGAKIFPFKLHLGRQISDAELKTLVVPNLWGGFWKHFDWGKAAEDGMKAAGLPYSGQYEFVDTGMYWAINHEVAPREQALNCLQCHTADDAVSCARCHTNVSQEDSATMVDLFDAMESAKRRPSGMDFEQLGYKGDPAIEGGRFETLPESSLSKSPGE